MLEIFLLLGMVAAAGEGGDEGPLPEPWDYAAPMARAARGFRGRPGVVLHVGDSNTYANPYGQWARLGQGRTDADRAVLGWMHAGSDDDTDGWYLARFDHPDGGHSFTACSGLQADELLAGGRSHLPPLEALLDEYRPQVVVLMIGTNDATNNRPVAAYRGDVERAVDLMLARGIIPILSTIPPHPGRASLARSYSEALRRLARSRGLPLIDFEREILRRRPDDWNGTLLEKDDVHPSTARGEVTPVSEPTPENLRSSGYLLRGWLSVRKIAEVKRAVLDRATPVGAEMGAGTGAAPARPAAAPLPAGALRVRVTRDTWFSNVGAEADGDNGGATRLKLESDQERSLVDIDPGPLRVRVGAEVPGARPAPRAARVADPAARPLEALARPGLPGRGRLIPGIRPTSMLRGLMR